MPQKSRSGSANEQLKEYINYHGTRENAEAGLSSRTDPIVEEEIVQFLARRAYHLPGNDWCSDWSQYILNTHPVLGICCHHELHPISKGMRVVALFGSFVFGLGISCIVLILMMFYQEDPDSIILEFHTEDSTYSITKGMIAVWTVGSGLHSLFDVLIWHMTACACFRPGGCCTYEICSVCRYLGRYFAIVTVVLVTGVAAFAVLLRAALESMVDVDMENLESGGLVDDEIYYGDLRREHFYYLLTYVIEVALAQLYHPVTGTILFSGVLGCGRLPFVGGRPYALRREEVKVGKLYIELK